MNNDDGIMLQMQEDGTWGIRKEPYATIEFPSKEDYEKLQEIIEKHQSGGWVPVSERLPKENEEVLITLAHGKATWAYLYQGEWNTMFSTYPIERVIAWQSLPEPFKEAYHGTM